MIELWVLYEDVKDYLKDSCIIDDRLWNRDTLKQYFEEELQEKNFVYGMKLSKEETEKYIMNRLGRFEIKEGICLDNDEVEEYLNENSDEVIKLADDEIVFKRKTLNKPYGTGIFRFLRYRYNESIVK